ncbi:MAG: cell division protein FtsX [Kiloniellales bacterium]
MFARRTDLPLGHDTPSRTVPWIIALMVYLAALALAGTMLLNELAGRWDAGLAGSLTVQIPSLEETRSTEAATDPDAQLAQALRVLRQTPGVSSATALDRQEIAALLEPWLGPGRYTAELPLPRLIDVSLEEAAQIDLEALARRLRDVAPGAVIEDHALWRQQLVSLARSIQVATLTVVGLIAIAAMLVVVFATQAALSTYGEVIEVMHLVGAHDDYLARQFQSHMVRKGLLGGVGGVALAVATLYGFAYGAQGIDPALFPHLTLKVRDWLTLGALPLAAALIAMYTARVTVLRVLGKMP